MVNNDVTEQILFNDVLPLPFRVLVLILIGTALWLLLNIICYRYQINILQLLNLSYSNNSYTLLDHGNINPTGEFASSTSASLQDNPLLMTGIWQNFKVLFWISSLSWSVFKFIQWKYIDSSGTDSSNDFMKLIYYLVPLISILYGLFVLFIQSTKPSSFGQYRMYTTIKRILLGGINSKTMRSNDILISDSLMSYSKVINDFGLFIWIYYINDKYNPTVELIILAIPTFIRLKQCWYEFRLTQQKQHLFNLCKYFSGLLPLLVNYVIKLTILSQPANLIDKLHHLNRWWTIFSLINSSYSFFWDIKMDWGFHFFDKLFKRSSKFLVTRPRNKLVYGNELIYYIVILIDFLLRFLWILKFFIISEEESKGQLTYLNIFSTFLFGYDAYSFGYFLIELFEILRRWMWCFIKLENDWIKIQPTSNQIDMIDIKTN